MFLGRKSVHHQEKVTSSTARSVILNPISSPAEPDGTGFYMAPRIGNIGFRTKLDWLTTIADTEAAPTHVGNLAVDNGSGPPNNYLARCGRPFLASSVHLHLELRIISRAQRSGGGTHRPRRNSSRSRTVRHKSFPFAQAGRLARRVCAGCSPAFRPIIWREGDTPQIFRAAEFNTIVARVGVLPHDLACLLSLCLRNRYHN